MKSILFAAFTLFMFSQCSDEEIVPTGATAAGATDIAPLPVQATGSVNISGIYTVYESIEDCSTCTFVVPADMAVVDGAELGLKAGAVICLDKAIQYGDVDFVNLEGTEQKPIRIGASVIK